MQEFTNYPIQLLEFGSVTDAVPPTQKPVDLLEYLIKTYTTKAIGLYNGFWFYWRSLHEYRAQIHWYRVR